MSVPTFKLTDLKRAIEGFKSCGLPIAAAEIRQDGSIVILTEAPKIDPIHTDPLSAWEKKRGLSA